MKNIEFKDIYPDGELLERLNLIFERLHCEWYLPEKVFIADQDGWPGDWEGRVILALTLLGQSTHREPKYLAEIILLLQDKLNTKGYMGRILPDGAFDEQQLSGNSWLLRGLIEYYAWKKDDKVLEIINGIIKNLLLPAKGYYKLYPSSPEERIIGGAAIGSLNKQMVGNWYTSTDIGCAFIMQDGATHAYELLKLPELKELIEEMIEKFLGIDLMKISAQTHSTLSAVRGILRYYKCTGRMDLLQAVEKIYDLYKSEGMTENYANYNWFKRPEWTEPCAYIDSFILSFLLWQNTKKINYLEDAQHIYYNAMGYGQRPNGGFGCDSSTGSKDEFVMPITGAFEAYWCCTMRGGEGLARAAEFSYFREDNGITIPFYNNSTAHLSFDDGDMIIKQATEYPIEGYIRLEVLYSNVVNKKFIKMFVPSFVSSNCISISVNNEKREAEIVNGFVQVELQLKAGSKIELEFDIELRTVPVMNKNSISGFHTYRHGMLILGYTNNSTVISIKDKNSLTYKGKGRYIDIDTGAVLSPINDMIQKTMEQAGADRRQLLFKD